ncbi:thioesterase-like superfamily-domain-containing protein [Delphinella strobiligena]|nr:thioesterase-like superfamily-domain-containing protein [Delphinella strobiligena]
MPSLSQDTTVKATSSHTYTANFPAHWCIGSVPHGGFVTSTFQQVASLHFRTTLSKQNQPHTMATHLSFLRRTETGLATFTVKDAKLGRATSTIHVTLSQSGREEVVAYITNTNLSTESGASFPTKWTLEPPPPKTTSIANLKAGKDPLWAEPTAQPFLEFRKAVQQVRFFFPRAGQHFPSLADQWTTLVSGERLTNNHLGFIVDTFPQIIENYRFAAGQEKGPFWYPTVLLNLDVKKLLPEDGVEGLFARTRAKEIKNGRYDLEVVVLDEGGDLVAVSHHVVMIVSAARNLAKRKNGSDRGDESKL